MFTEHLKQVSAFGVPVLAQLGYVVPDTVKPVQLAPFAVHAEQVPNKQIGVALVKIPEIVGAQSIADTTHPTHVPLGEHTFFPLEGHGLGLIDPQATQLPAALQ